MGLGDHGTTGVPTKQGFDEFFGYLHQAHAHFYYPEYLWHNDERYPLPGNTNGERQQYTHDIIMEKAYKFLGKYREAPFFLYLSLTIPHYELLVPEDSLDEYQGRFSETPFTGRQALTYRVPRPAQNSSNTKHRSKILPIPTTKPPKTEPENLG